MEGPAVRALWLGTWKNNERAYGYKDDEHKASSIRRKEAVASTATAAAPATATPATATR